MKCKWKVEKELKKEHGQLISHILASNTPSINFPRYIYYQSQSQWNGGEPYLSSLQFDSDDMSQRLMEEFDRYS
jgi:hypothetical protein